MTLIDLTQLEEDSYTIGRRDDGESSDDYPGRENEHLRYLLFATARKYNQTYKELESLKEFHGFYNNPLTFLRFPREIRDQIYFYALRSPLTTSTTTRYAMYGMLGYSGESPFKPPTQGLVYANKQVNKEATEVLYSRNIFRFKLPREIFDFENQIGPINCGHIRHINIWSMVPNDEGDIPLPETLVPHDYEEYPSHWAKTFQLCSFQNVNEMTIEIYCPGAPGSFCGMEASLRNSIEELLFRNRHSQNHRRITLRGFGWNEWEKFSRNIGVITRQLTDVEEEIEAPEEELAEGLQADREAAEAAWATERDDNDNEVFEDTLEDLSTYLEGI
jgi:hypothetical protein